MNTSEPDYKKFKQLCEKEGIILDNDAEYREVADSLISIYEVLGEADQEEQVRLDQLKQQPEGFAMPTEGRSCPLCRYVNDEDFWYDKWGMKCMDCQDALRRKLVPGYIFTDYAHQRCATADVLAWKYGVRPAVIRGLVRKGILRARIIPHRKYSSTMLFLYKENPKLDKVIQYELGS